MAYSTGQLIEASDYNNFANSVNVIWSTGSGDRGYGQTALNLVVAESDEVTAAQWSTLLNTVNSITQHQGNAAPFATVPVSGDVISSIASVETNITTANTNALAFTAGSTSTIGSAISDSIVLTGSSTLTETSMTVELTWTNEDQRRYFFNTGGQIIFDVTSATATVTNARTTAIVTALATALNAFTLRARATIAGGTSGFDTGWSASKGFYDLTSTNQTIYSISFGATYSPNTNERLTVNARLVDSAGSYKIRFELGTVIGFGSTSANDDGTINYAVQMSKIESETTHLTKTWGDDPTVSSTV